MPVDTSSFIVSVDGIFVGEYPLVSADGVYTDVRAFLPVLPAGEHTVRLFWNNVHMRLAVQIKDLQLQSLGGPDSDANGVKDWVESSVNAMAGIDRMSNNEQGMINLEGDACWSYVSPACIEGDTRYVPFMSITNSTLGIPVDVQRSAGARWYANIPLNENDKTDASVLFQSGALEVPVSITWKPYNLIDHDGETLFIRKDDALRLTCIDPARAFDDLEHARGGRFELSVSGADAAGTAAVRIAGVPPASSAVVSVSSPNTRPITAAFTNAGVYVVSGEYTKGNDAMTASVTVQVLDGSFPEESPACLIGQEREWTFSGIPENVVFETDDTVQMEVVETASTTNNLELTTVSLLASEVNLDHTLIARTCPGGAILDSAKLNPFFIQNAADGYFWTVEYFEDSQLWEVESIQQNMPDDVEVEIKVIVGGVLFDDYTLERWISNADYDEIGIYPFRLFHPNEEAASVCHTFMVYQGGEFVGEVLGGE